MKWFVHKIVYITAVKVSFITLIWVILTTSLQLLLSCGHNDDRQVENYSSKQQEQINIEINKLNCFFRKSTVPIFFHWKNNFALGISKLIHEFGVNKIRAPKRKSTKFSVFSSFVINFEIKQFLSLIYKVLHFHKLNNWENIWMLCFERKCIVSLM